MLFLMRYGVLAVVAVMLAIFGVRLALSSPEQDEPPGVQSLPDSLPTRAVYVDTSVGRVPCAVYPGQKPTDPCVPDPNYLFGPEGPPPTATPVTTGSTLASLPAESKLVLAGGDVVAIVGACGVPDIHSIEQLRDPRYRCLTLHYLADAGPPNFAVSVVSLGAGGKILSARYETTRAEAAIEALLNDRGTRLQLLDLLEHGQSIYR